MNELNGIAEAYASMKVQGEPQPVNEASLTHILGHQARGYGIISACRNENDAKTNRQQTERLKEDIRAAGLGYIPVRGGFKEDTPQGKVDVYETSLLVPCHEIDGEEAPFDHLEDTLLRLGQKYGQQSVLICPPDGKPRYVVTTPYSETDDEGNVTTTYKVGDVAMEFSGNMKLNDLAQDYFTSLNSVERWPEEPLGKNPRRFTFESAEFPGDSLTYQQGHIRHRRGEINHIRR